MNNNKNRKQWQKILFFALIFFSMLIFFWRLHPVPVIDGDDIIYIQSVRPAIPLPGSWNPIRVLPEVLMPVCGNIAGIMAALGLGSFIDCQVFSLALILSGFICFYVFAFYRLIEEKFALGSFGSMSCSAVFLLLHFLVFRVSKTENVYMFHSYDACCYFFYTIGHLLNWGLVMLLLCPGKERISLKSPFKSSLWLLAVYFALFSNLYCNISLASACGCLLLFAIIKAIRNKSGFKKLVKDNSFNITVLVMWLAALIIEYSGGRAHSLAGEISFFERVGEAFACLAEDFAKTSVIFKLLLLMSLLAAGLVLVLGKDRESKKKFLAVSGTVLLSGLIVSVFILLLSAVVYPDYLARMEVIFPIMSALFLFMLLCIGFALQNFRPALLLMPLVLIFLFSMTNTGYKTFRDSNAFSCDARTAVAIQNDIFDKIAEACESGQKELHLELIQSEDYVNNWPQNLNTGEVFLNILHKYALVEGDVEIIPVPSMEYNEKFGLDIIK